MREDGYRILSLAELAALNDEDDKGLADELDLDEDEMLAVIDFTGLRRAAQSVSSVDDVLERLIRNAQPLPDVEISVFADMTPAQQELVRTNWPHVRQDLRREILMTAVGMEEERFDLDFSAFFRIVLDDADATVRMLAVEGLGFDTQMNVIGRLIHLLETDPTEEVRAAAARSLGIYVLEGELDEFDAALAVRAEQALLGVINNSAEPVSVRSRALESIAYSGDTGVRQLIEDAYYSPNEAMRVSSLVAMGRSVDARWRKLAQVELTNPSEEMRAQAAYACGELEVRSALGDLLRLLSDRSQSVRLAAIYALGHIGGDTAMQALQEIVAGDNEVEALVAEDALDEMAFYAGAEADGTQLFAEAADWGDDDDPADDDLDLGEYV
ncbi:MAG: HEAT repeat domain-containing protein [Anaerolineales bacterium]|nr:HEAT repeat domain-containing protein [Anaerolineales bacterium]